MKRVRAIIEGRVQGVWFRAWTVDEASKRGLDGWVRNRRDGAVEELGATARFPVAAGDPPARPRRPRPSNLWATFWSLTIFMSNLLRIW